MAVVSTVVVRMEDTQRLALAFILVNVIQGLGQRVRQPALESAMIVLPTFITHSMGARNVILIPTANLCMRRQHGTATTGLSVSRNCEYHGNDGVFGIL